LFVLTRRRFLSLTAVPASIALAPAAWAALEPISTERLVPIGGIDQWIAIRGRNRSRMAILFLHGGPCEAQSPFLSIFAPWEERYVVAQWDQRGSGRSFKDGTSTPNMTFEQLVQDAVEVTRYVLAQLRIRKLILVGHSAGSILGLSVVRSRPELFHAFVATGQPVNGKEIFESMRSSAVVRAKEAKNDEAVSELNGLKASDMSDAKKLFGMLSWEAPFPGADDNFLAMRGAFTGSPAKPINAEAAHWFSASQACLPKLVRIVFDFNASAAGLDLPVPYFVIQGRNDTRAPPELARAFVNAVRAPAKGYTAIEGGHFACFSNPTGFLNALDSDIRGLHIS
jgi:pimeloyl-ACP methyl ester carboxylesterase